MIDLILNRRKELEQAITVLLSERKAELLLDLASCAVKECSYVRERWLELDHLLYNVPTWLDQKEKE